ncbi:hypothetical protein [Paractinoplanes maris]|uniref:hypothetical protein n=1 Tax=Paractinoplanes maris TaxID=1734446 RepID=UPI002021333F|nr:hypothetical protein [Actinoplanes maris]
MSDNHAWPPARTPEQQALDNAQLARAHLGQLVQQLKGDDNQPWRGRLLAAVGDLDRFTDGLEQGAVEVEAAPSAQAPVPMRRPEPEQEPAEVPGGAHRLMGEDTRAWFKGGNAVPMRRNRGPQ